MLLVVCVLLSAVCLASIASAQTDWQKTYGGAYNDRGVSVEQTTDGGYMVAGVTMSFGRASENAYLVKSDAQGDTLWTRTYGGLTSTSANSAHQTADGGYIVTGWVSVPEMPHDDVYLVRTDEAGDTLWTRAYGGAGDDVGWSVRQTADGGYIVAGATSSYGAGNSDVYLIKTDAQGDTLWTRTYGGPGQDLGCSVQQTADGGYIVAGSTSSYGAGSGDVYLIKTDSSGDTLWTRTYGGPYEDYGYSVRRTSDCGYIIGGATASFGAGALDVYVIRTDSQGDTLWTRTYGGAYADLGNSVLQAEDGGYAIAGETYSFGAGGYDVYLIKTHADPDVGPVAILSPLGIAESGHVYVPSVVVRNFGLTSATFPVTMDIGTGYVQTMQETLASGVTDTVVFPSWTAGPMGSLKVMCFTSLVGDEDPTNDTIRDSIQVVPQPRHDVGATAIISPSGNLRTGDVVVPRAQIKNFGSTAERFFDVRFRIGTSYSRTANVANALLPDSTVELTFGPWVADSGNWAVSCSTMLASDVSRANDKVSSSVQVFAQSLSIGPDQSGQLAAGQSKTYQFYALIQGDTGGVVEVARPSAQTGWDLRLGSATGAQDLTDTDGDGIPDLGHVAPGESSWFSLDVTAPSGLVGDTASLASTTFLIAGHLSDDSRVADTAVLNLTRMPAFSVHNFPNPFSDHTAFVIGLPNDGKASLTIYTRAGEKVCRVLENIDEPAGIHVVRWDGVNDNGRSIAPGTYEYVLDYEHKDKTERISKKLVLTRQ